MAEERLIDDDKDRKYKIRKNADGEDELYVDLDGEEEEEKESIEFEVPEFETDDEEASVLTPEQYAERERLKREEEERNRERIDELLSHARQLIDEQSYEGALYCISEAEEIKETDGQIAVVKLLATTEKLRTFSGEEVESAVEGVENNSTAEQKAELLQHLERLEAEEQTLSKDVERLYGENEEKKAERRAVFVKKRNKAIAFFVSSGVPFIVFLILGIYYATIMHAVKDGRNIILTFVFFGIAGALFIVFLIASHLFWASAKKVSLNEKNSSTKTGREYEGKREQLSIITRIITAVKAEENPANEDGQEEKAVEENDLS